MSLMARIEKEKQVAVTTNEKVERPVMGHPVKQTVVDPLRDIKKRVHETLLKEVAADVLDRSDDAEVQEQLKQKIEEIVGFILDHEYPATTRNERLRILGEINDEVLGFGPINSLILDPTVSEIMVNGPQQVYVERQGRLELSGVKFRDNEHVLHIIEKIVSPIGRRIDESSPMVDARLPDGSRVNAIIPPLALKGPTITIRKFAKEPFTVNDLVNFGTLTREMAEFLDACVKVKLNLVVSGGTGSGKTTTLNVLSSFIPADERIVTIEDAAELQLRQEHVVSLETRPANIEGKGAVTMRDLVKNSLRMRPDRIVV
ncbi:MAG TPA: ATPase, T2SS/T4P/T4SS family, partial [Bacillota bacterium]|nr:ATPase, T2SS/T4P/T4SS family [Bacillota bacterium]